jgi:multimeric flavodoxin WrbA
MFLIFTASPNLDGLTAACGKAAYEGITRTGNKAEMIDLSAEKIAPCNMCGGGGWGGWGPCYDAPECIIPDLLPQLRKKIRAAQGLVFVTPVYYGQPSERMNYFLNRLRRLEARFEDRCSVGGKTIDLIAAAGGGGGGGDSCLADLERWCYHMHAKPGGQFWVTQKNKDEKLNEIRNAYH